MTPQESIDLIHGSAVTLSRAMLIDETGDGAISPIILTLNGNDDMIIISLLGLNINDDKEKYLLSKMLPSLFAERNIVCYAMMTEAWSVDGASRGRQPKDRDDKKEVVFINIRHRDGQFRASFYEMIRDWTTAKVIDLVLLNDLKTGDGNIRGTFGNFFEEPTQRSFDLALTA